MLVFIYEQRVLVCTPFVLYNTEQLIGVGAVNYELRHVCQCVHLQTAAPAPMAEPMCVHARLIVRVVRRRRLARDAVVRNAIAPQPRA